MNKIVKILLLFLLAAIPLVLPAQQSYRLRVNRTDKDTAASLSFLNIPDSFASRDRCLAFLNELPLLLRAQGYVTASLDKVEMDSVQAQVWLFLGEKYAWAKVDVSQVDKQLLESTGWREQSFQNRPLDFDAVKEWQNKMLTWLENNGHPFAKVWLDSVRLTADGVQAKWMVDSGPSYKIDSIRVYGNAKISNEFLQRYLMIPHGSMFSKEKLLSISRRIRELPYVEEEQPSKLIWLNSGSVIELYLKQKRSSQVNVLVGFLPNNDQLGSRKLMVTGEANLNLKNALGAGETIGLNWQQLQKSSPRLTLLYQHPYLFGTVFGLDFNFNMYRKDSTFLNVNFQLGATYALDARQTGKVFIQRFQGIVNGVNTQRVLQQYKLPEEADISAVNIGLGYEYNSTNYRFNPTRGDEWKITTSMGSKKIKKNNQILELTDPLNPGFKFESLYDTVKLKAYQFRAEAQAAHYFPLSNKGRTTLKTAIQGGFLQSASIFRNELFQIGGFKLLRGFDEESQFLSQFAIGTAEFRYLVGQNSYFYAFVDGGWGKNASLQQKLDYTYLGTGLGLAFESKVGIFNMAWAVGKRSDTELNLRQSKIHFGFLNFF